MHWRNDALPSENPQVQICSAKLSALQSLAKVSRNHLASNLAFSLSFTSLDNFVGYRHLQFEKVIELSKHFRIKTDSLHRSRLSHHSRKIGYPSLLPLDYPLLRLLSDIDSSLSDLPQYAFKAKQEKEFFQEKFRQHVGDPRKLAQAISNLRQQDWRAVSKAAFVSLAKDARLNSAALQLLLEEDDCSPDLMALLEATKAELLKDKLGCHVVRRALAKSQSFKTSVTRLVEPCIVDLACNEYSSRVLQALAAADSSFACRFVRSFLDHWKQLSSHISAVFLFSVCLQLAPKLDATVAEVGEQLLRLSADPMNSRNNKRVLVSYLEYCEPTFVVKFYEILGFETRFTERMDDKYMVYIFSVFLARGYPKAANLLMAQMSCRLAALLNSRYFRFLLCKVYNSNKNLDLQFEIDDLLAAMFGRLAAGRPDAALLQVADKDVCFMFKLLATSASHLVQPAVASHVGRLLASARPEPRSLPKPPLH
jgi:hypothetical protein